jgi:SUKH superfamily protein
LPVKRDFEALRERYPEFTGDYTPPWGLPQRTDFDGLTERYGVQFPPSYLEYCTKYASRLPADNGFMWASAKPGEAAYASLQATIEHAREWGVASSLVPFWEDEGNFYCFDTTKSPEDREFPVVFWDHDQHGLIPPLGFPCFVDWLASCLEG